MKMRKLLSLLTAVCLIASVIAVGGADMSAAASVFDAAGDSGINAEETRAAVPDGSARAISDVGPAAEKPGAGAKSSGRVLVVCFSATGREKAVAENVASSLDADVFVIEPEDEYTKADLDCRNKDSRICREKEDEKLQEQVRLETTDVENWDSYDTVFIGYPVWWGKAAWPVDRFVENNDFSGKTVIPFSVSASSDNGKSAEALRKKAGTGNWLDGRRFAPDTDKGAAARWARSVVR
ncbi:MAG: flavodoxin [Anaerovoracaceae bacterium]|nr:flavodoxin [Anaerovoracaceae bacterium]